MAASIAFHHQSSRRNVRWGETYALPKEEGFRDTTREELLLIVEAVKNGKPWRAAVDEAFAERKPWLHQVITSPLRTRFFQSVLPLTTGPVLDIGAGWGQISRPLAARGRVVALEPVAERLAFIRAAAEQENVAGAMAFVQADYLEVEFERQFGGICAIGVLEWAGAFQDKEDPQERQRRFLRKTKSELQEGGSLVLGIENRIGLKYLLGCPDDHIGTSGIACLPAPLARRRWNESTGHELRSFTYTQFELTALLRDAGYSKVEFFAAFPDYKLPEVILPLGVDGAEVNHWLANHDIPAEHNGYDGTALTPEFDEALRAQYRTLAQDDVAHAFVPSFFVRAS